jgi:hypothetical protein
MNQMTPQQLRDLIQNDLLPILQAALNRWPVLDDEIVKIFTALCQSDVLLSDFLATIGQNNKNLRAR